MKKVRKGSAISFLNSIAFCCLVLCFSEFSAEAQKYVPVDTVVTVIDEKSKIEFLEIRDFRKDILESGKIQDGKKQGQWVAYHQPDSVLRKVAYFSDGKEEGLVIHLNKKQELELEELFSEGVLNGLSRSYERGRVTDLVNYKNGVKEGLQKSFYSNKKVQEESFFRNGKKHGISTWYHDNEKLLTQYNYENGSIEGEVKSYYKDGTLKTESFFKKNEINGIYKQFHENGELKLQGNYKNGKKVGDWIKYDAKGKKIKKDTYKNGELVGNKNKSSK